MLQLDDASMLAFARTCLEGLEKQFAAVLERPVKVELSVASGGRGADSPRHEAAASAAEIEAAAQIPLVRKAMDLLNARIVAVEPASRSPKP